MPRETFLNLPAAKQEAVINAALEEFAKYPYRSFINKNVNANCKEAYLLRIKCLIFIHSWYSLHLKENIFGMCLRMNKTLCTLIKHYQRLFFSAIEHLTSSSALIFGKVKMKLIQ